MTRDEQEDAILDILKEDFDCGNTYGYKVAEKIIEALKTQPCEDAVSRKVKPEEYMNYDKCLRDDTNTSDCVDREAVLLAVCTNCEKFCSEQKCRKYTQIANLPSVQPERPRCKDCKHFESDVVAKVDGIPLIVGHEMCKRWGDGCKTSEDGYCFLFEPKEGVSE